MLLARCLGGSVLLALCKIVRPQSELTRSENSFFDGDVPLGTSGEEKLFAVEVSRSGSGELPRKATRARISRNFLNISSIVVKTKLLCYLLLISASYIQLCWTVNMFDATEFGLVTASCMVKVLGCVHERVICCWIDVDVSPVPTVKLPFKFPVALLLFQE